MAGTGRSGSHLNLSDRGRILRVLPREYIRVSLTCRCLWSRFAGCLHRYGFNVGPVWSASVRVKAAAGRPINERGHHGGVGFVGLERFLGTWTLVDGSSDRRGLPRVVPAGGSRVGSHIRTPGGQPEHIRHTGECIFRDRRSTSRRRDPSQRVCSLAGVVAPDLRPTAAERPLVDVDLRRVRRRACCAAPASGSITALTVPAWCRWPSSWVC